MTAPLLTEAQIVELRELRAKATPGLWFVDPDDRPGMGWNNHICADPHLRVAFMAHDGSMENDRGEANAALIVAAVNALPALLSAAEKAAEAEARAARAEATASTLRETLEWYGEQARLCRLIHSEGDKGRNALAADGGARARALTATQGEQT